jgi:hypothetical protein
MKHQQFEEWLFSEEKLIPEQEMTLSQHLETCRSCSELASAWSDLEFAFQQSPHTGPAPGFTERWERKREAYEYKQRSWKGWLVLSIAVVFAAVLLLAPAVPALASPMEVISEIVDAFVNLIAFVSAIWSVIESVGQLLPQVSLPFMLSVINFSVVMLATVWLLAIRKLAYNQGV